MRTITYLGLFAANDLFYNDNDLLSKKREKENSRQLQVKNLIFVFRCKLAEIGGGGGCLERILSYAWHYSQQFYLRWGFPQVFVEKGLGELKVKDSDRSVLVLLYVNGAITFSNGVGQ